ncbi:MAG: hypothetical protein LAT84_07605 [Balneolia bacterium]|nr:hypothetical protein [Balneolia bacterium]
MKTITLFAILVLFLTSCDTVDPFNPADLTEEDLAEAYGFALWYTGEIEPSEADIESAARTLNQIRTRYGNRSDFFQNRFITPWRPGLITVMLSDEARSRFEEDGSLPWDDIRPGLLPSEVSFFPISEQYAYLRFRADLNPGALCRNYLQLEGIERCAPEYYIFSGFGGYGVIVEVVSDRERRFLFTSQQTFGDSGPPQLVIEINGSLSYFSGDVTSHTEGMYDAFLRWQIPQQESNDFEPHFRPLAK